MAIFNQDTLVVLSFVPNKDQLDSWISGAMAKGESSNIPEVRLYNKQNFELYHSDALPVAGFQKYQPNDYRLSFKLKTSKMQSNFEDNVDPESKLDESISSLDTIYILCPKDFVIAEKYQSNDILQWYLNEGKIEKALELAEQDLQKLSDIKRQQMLTSLEELNTTTSSVSNTLSSLTKRKKNSTLDVSLLDDNVAKAQSRYQQIKEKGKIWLNERIDKGDNFLIIIS